jgi:hypothetical protein
MDNRALAAPKKKRRKASDSAYSSKQHRSNPGPVNPNGMLHIRADHDKNIKTSYEIKPQNIKSKFPLRNAELDEALQALDNGASYRPTKKIAADEWQTPGGSKMKVFADLGAIILLSNKVTGASPASRYIPTESIDANHEFYNSPAYDRIRKFADATKDQTLIIDSTLLDASYKERAKNHFKRIISQNCLMADSSKNKDGSATQYADSAGLITIPGVKWEWLHLIAHEIAASKAQNTENLVAGTYHANTLMYMAESGIKYLNDYYPQGFTLQVSARMVEKKSIDENKEFLQLGTTIDYKLITTDFELPLQFDAQSQRKPHKDFMPMIHNLIKVMIQLSKDHEMKTKPMPEKVLSNAKRSILFTPLDKENQTPKEPLHKNPRVKPK